LVAQVKRDIPESDLTKHTPRAGGGAYYVLAVTPPEVRRVQQAWIEFRADLAVPEINGFRYPTSLFQVFMLNRELTDEPTEEDLEPLRVPMSRPVATGDNRSIKIDVTEFVQRILADPSANRGLVLGAVTGDRRGDFAIKSGVLGPGLVARLTIVE
jgi:hypothetical protein